MVSKLSVIHRKKPETFSPEILNPKESWPWQFFVTCLRSLAISFDDQKFPDIKATDQVYEGDKAYRFLLEVACGLQSPILGETEVFGQFREFADRWTEHTAIFQNVYADVKSVRQAHLTHLGSQSYGSWVRKQVQRDLPVHIIGTGQLAQEIYIWLRKQNSNIHLYSRAAQRAERRLRQAHAAEVSVCDFTQTPNLRGSAVIVATHVRAKQVQDWLGDQRPALMIDLRDESNTNRIAPVDFSLHDVFSEIEKGRHQAQHKIEQARRMIDEIVAKRFWSQTIRPFGWDDLCA